ncbi:aldehyde dehydrogenase, dimeric NADP-preferring-like [Euwallacea similis]|uniref:aldehyde dehydrogenase, dimeric NADP-preferring-like n=1 Tax=Euwallacea similis TaxID=1736056 RepID=UPI00344EAC73
MSECGPCAPIPRLDPHLLKTNASNGISPKISQLHQFYSQEPKIPKECDNEHVKRNKMPKISKEHQNELRKQSSSINRQHPEKGTIRSEEKRIPKRLFIDQPPIFHEPPNMSNEDLESISFPVNDTSLAPEEPDGNPIIQMGNGTTTSVLIEPVINPVINHTSNGTMKDLHLNGVTTNNGSVKKSIGDKKNETDSIITVDSKRAEGKYSAKECVEIARRAFKTGRTRKLGFRERQLRGLLKFLESHRLEIEEALFKDLKKHRQETNICEIEIVANDLRYTIMNLQKWIGPQRPKKRFINLLDDIYVYNDPYGVVLLIGAWNYPILLTLGPLVGALAGGNTIILKPSELVPATNKLLSDVLTNYLDQECFQIYTGGAQETTELLQERLDYIFFTGSSKIGQIVYQTAAKNLIPCTLELGGKCPLYIDNTADMYKSAKRALWGRMLNSGQTCVAPDYILCTKEVEERFLKEAEKVLKEFWGEDPSKSPSLSKIMTENHYRRLLEFMRMEHIALGGQVNAQEYVIGPTILTDVSPLSPVMEEEIFGPLLPILNVKNAQEAVDFINSREKPLALYVFSKNIRVQQLFLYKTSSGGVSINDTISHIGTEKLPFGGVGMSGLGNYHGKYGFDTFTHKKGVLVKDLSYISELTLKLRYPPYSDKKTTLISTILKKRRRVNLKYLDRLILFCLGIGLAFLLQYYYRIIQ